MRLHSLFQSQHLDKEALKRYKNQYLSHGARILQVSDLLKSDIANHAANFLLEQSALEQVFGLYSKKGHVASKREWASAPAEDHFFRYSMLAGQSPGSNGLNSTELRAFLKLRQALNSVEFREFLEVVLGHSLGTPTTSKVHSMSQGDFLSPHDDRAGHRKVAYILYLTPGWKSEFGGQLKVWENNGNEFTLEPNFNSLVLFDVRAHKQHAVEKVTAPPSVSRLSIGGWFRE